MHGQINSIDGAVKVEIHKAFRILLTVILFFPIVGIVLIPIMRLQNISPVMIFVAIGQITMIRFLFIELTFRYLSRESLNKLRDVLDVDWIEN